MTQSSVFAIECVNVTFPIFKAHTWAVLLNHGRPVVFPSPGEQVQLAGLGEDSLLSRSAFSAAVLHAPDVSDPVQPTRHSVIALAAPRGQK